MSQSETHGIAGKILLVDDDADFNAIHRYALSGRGYDVDVARSAAEAEKKLEMERPDVVVLDVALESKMAGFELVRKMERLAPGVPAVLVSGMRGRGAFRFRPNESWEPVVDFLDKPVAPDHLAKRIEQILAS